MEGFIKIIAVSLAFMAVLGIASGCKNNKKATASSSTVGNASVTKKPSAKSVIDAYNKNKYKVEVEKKDLYNVNKVIVSKTTVLNVNENAASGILNGVIFTISDAKAERDAKLAQFYTEIKKVILACDISIKPERADEMVAYLKQAEPVDPSYFSTRSVQENIMSYTVSYAPEELSFIVT